jgi:hypothetical protein
MLGEYASAQISTPTPLTGGTEMGTAWSAGLDHTSEPTRMVIGKS